MSSNDFKVGDVVRLKSGSMPMTVANIKQDFIECKWFNQVGDFPEGLSLSNSGSANYKYSNHQIGVESFPHEALEKVQKS